MRGLTGGSFERVYARVRVRHLLAFPLLLRSPNGVFSDGHSGCEADATVTPPSGSKLCGEELDN